MNTRRRTQFRAGYSFTEVMFAVVVLGIGFIMIAAMFPVAISQSKTTSEETSASAIARGGVNYLDTIATGRNMPPTDAANPTQPALVVPFIGTPAAAPPYTMTPAGTGSWQAIRGSLVLAADPRYAFVPMYRRETGSNQAQVFVVAVQSRARSRYDDTDTVNLTGAQVWYANLKARPVTVNVNPSGGGPNVPWIQITNATGANMPQAAAAVAEGTYVVIAADPGGNAGSPIGTFNGRIYRVGAQAVDATGAAVANTWTLQPGNDYAAIKSPGPNGTWGDADDTAYDLGTDATALIVGSEYNMETAPADDFRGPAQDIAIYTSFIQVRP
jgi:hypothetical protein